MRTISLVLLILMAGSAQAQIVVPEANAPHTVIAAKFDRTFPAGSKAKYLWSGSEGVHFGEGTADNKTAYLTAPPSDKAHRLRVTAAWLEDGAMHLESFPAEFYVGSKPDPEPQPVKTLRDLAGELAPLMAEFYADLRTAAPLADSPRQFHSAHLAALGRVPDLIGNAALPVIAERVEKAIGRSAEKFTPEQRTTLDKCLAGIVDELGKPEPDPKPPTPEPAPIPAAGLHVLIVEETNDRGVIPAGQLSVLQSTKIQAHVAAAGGEFRQYDDDPAVADPKWSAAMARPRTALPWIIVSNGGKGGVEQPLPESIDETIALIRKYE